MELSITPSLGIQAAVIILSVVVCLWWSWACGHAYSAGSRENVFNWRAALTCLGLLGACSATLLILSQQSWIHNFDSFPPNGLRVFIVLLVLMGILAFSPIGKRLATATPLYLLIGFQAFRIPTEFFIHGAYNEGLAPLEMTYLDRNMDIVSGIIALILAIMVFRKTVSTKLILAWNILGLALLLNIIGTAIMTMPHPLQMIDTATPNIWVTFSPFILLPGILVSSAFLGHLLVFRYLSQLKKEEALSLSSKLAG